MKSREEYRKSIFAKRDALLRKRKKNITKAVTGTAAAIVMTVSLIAVPEITAKLPLDSEQATPDITATQAMIKEESVTQQHSDYDSYAESEDTTDTFSETASVTYAYYLTSDETIAATASETKKSPETDEFATESAESVEEMTSSTEATNKNEEVAIMGEMTEHSTVHDAEKPADTGSDYAAERGSDSPAPEAADSSDDYTQEEIISAATTYLPDDAKKLADPENAFVTVTRTSEGEEYYEVRFDINGNKHKITLDGDTLEFVSAESTNGSTSEQPQVQTSPPYNPNS